MVAPERRLIGYTTKPLVCPFPDLPPMVGYARTVTIRSVLKSNLPADEQARRRIAYYEYVGTGFGPRITVIQDIDGADVGYGAFWGEVQSNVHKALGCLGVITDGSIRDIPQWAPGFQALAGVCAMPASSSIRLAMGAATPSAPSLPRKSRRGRRPSRTCSIQARRRRSCFMLPCTSSAARRSRGPSR